MKTKYIIKITVYFLKFYYGKVNKKVYQEIQAQWTTANLRDDPDLFRHILLLFNLRFLTWEILVYKMISFVVHYASFLVSSSFSSYN